MTLAALRTGVVEAIRDTLPDLRDVTTHPGRFDLGELKRIAARSPSVRVAILSVQRGEGVGTGQVDARVQMSAFIVTTDTKNSIKDVAVLEIVEPLLTLVHRQTWGVDRAMPATNIAASNLYSGSVDRQGVAIWAVTWSQDVRLGECHCGDLDDPWGADV